MAGASTTIISSTVSANTAGLGGGIFNNEGTVNIQNNSIIGEIGFGNTATAKGGGIFNYLGTTTVDNSTVSSNNAPDGGGIFNGGNIYLPSTINIQNGSIIGGAGAGNTATVNGGGIYNDELGVTTVMSSTVSANTASDGAGIYNEAGVTIQGGSIIGGDGGANTATNGGGIYNDDGTTWLDDSIVISNTASTHGGGIYNDATLDIKNGSAVSANSAVSNGGGIYHRGTLTISSSTIGGIGFGNTAGNYGGGIYNVLGKTTVDASTISANTADYGGGIYSWATLIIRNNSLIGGEGAGNISTYQGGGIYISGGPSTITGSRIKHNTASNGGGIFENYGVAGATSMTGSCFVGNSHTSFFNNLTAAQIATGNWWGSSTGPNTPGADTVNGNVDTSGYLTSPILGCKMYIYLPLIMK